MCLTCHHHEEEEIRELNTLFLDKLKEKGAIITKLPSANSDDPSCHMLTVSLQPDAMQRAADSVSLRMSLKVQSCVVGPELNSVT